MTRAAAQQEWRQFQILARDGVRTLLNAAMLARDADPAQFALWTTALVATPPAMYAFSQMFKYSLLRGARPDLVERIIMADRMFFIVYGLIAAALLAAATWDALYPDRDDQEILGALPVRARTVTAARLTSALGVAAAFGVAISAPSAALFSFVSLAGRSLALLPLVMFAHVFATVCGCLTVFSLLLLTRAVVSLILGNAVTDKLATGLQLVTVIALVEVFFYLPSLLPVLMQGMMTGAAATAWSPSTWFGSLFNVIAGPRYPVFAGQALRGLTVMLAVVGSVIPMYLLPAHLMARRTLESQPARRRNGLLAETVRRAVSAAAGTARAASIARFALTSLARSRRHAVVVVTYAGFGTALALIQVIASGLRTGIETDAPTGPLLAAPLIVMFFLAAGMRAAFKVPRDFDANWIFRLLAPSAVEAARGTLATLYVGAIVPITVLSGLAAEWFGWSPAVIWRLVLFEALSGLFLLECMLYGWSLLPFACARPTGAEGVRVKWLAAVGPFLAFTIAGSGLQGAALRSWRFALGFTVALAAATLAISMLRVARLKRERIPFDAVVGHIEVLNLSEALH